MAAPTTDDFKVKLVSAIDQSIQTASRQEPSATKKTYAEKVVVFTVPPEIVEAGTVLYDAVQVLHGPTSFQMYKGTPSRTYNMNNIKLISRTPSEARDNIQTINLLRSWRMPYYGQSTTTTQDINSFFSQAQAGQTISLDPYTRLVRESNSLKERLGAPPEILYFSAYTQSNRSTDTKSSVSYMGNINRVPVVLSNLSITYPNEVTYIPTAMRGSIDALGGVPFPVIMTVNIDLLEAHSPYEANQFNLAKYTAGVLDWILKMSTNSINNTNSRYSKGGITDQFPTRLGWWERIVFAPNNDDIVLTISAIYHQRPDLLSFDAYGTPSYTWIILQYNNILDINTEFVEGATITIPTATRVATEII